MTFGKLPNFTETCFSFHKMGIVYTFQPTSQVVGGSGDVINVKVPTKYEGGDSDPSFKYLHLKSLNQVMFLKSLPHSQQCIEC